MSRQGLISGYKPNPISKYIVLLSCGRTKELEKQLYKDMEVYKINEPFYLIDIFQDNVNRSDTEGTSFARSCELIPYEVTSKFGYGIDGDGYKVSREYWFKNTETNTIITLYDWKRTTLYDPEYLRPSEFWKLDEPTTFNIGSKDHADTYGFVKWLRTKLK